MIIKNLIFSRSTFAKEISIHINQFDVKKREILTNNYIFKELMGVLLIVNKDKVNFVIIFLIYYFYYFLKFEKSRCVKWERSQHGFRLLATKMVYLLLSDLKLMFF